MIAQKVGITKPSIYYHFSTKEELISQAFDYIFKDHYFKSYFQIEEVTLHNFAQCLYQGGLNMLPDPDKSHNAVLRVLNEFATLAEREEMYRARLSAIQQDFLTGFQQLLSTGFELGAVPSGNLAYKAHLLALSIDGISRCKLMGIGMDYEGVWKEAVNSVLKQDFIIQV